MKRKIIGIVILVSLSVFCFAGCSNKEVSSEVDWNGRGVVADTEDGFDADEFAGDVVSDEISDMSGTSVVQELRDLIHSDEFVYADGVSQQTMLGTMLEQMESDGRVMSYTPDGDGYEFDTYDGLMYMVSPDGVNPR